MSKSKQKVRIKVKAARKTSGSSASKETEAKPSPISQTTYPPFDTEAEELHRGHYKEAEKLKFLVALARHRGVISPACREVNVARKTIYQWLKTDNLFYEAFEAVKEETIELLETTAYSKAVEEKDGVMLRWLLAANSQKYRNLTGHNLPPEDDKPEDKTGMAAILTTQIGDGRTVAEVLRDTYRQQEAQSNGQ